MRQHDSREVAPGRTVTETVQVNKAELAQTPALGWMVVSHDNRSRDEAQLIEYKTR